MMLIILDLEEKSIFQKEARSSIENSKPLCHDIKIIKKLLISYIVKRYDKIITENKADIETQKIIIQSLKSMQEQFDKVLNK